MKAQTLLKTITVAGALAATLTLSACDMHISFGQDGQEQGQGQDGQRAQEQPTEDTETTAEEPASDAGASTDSAGSGSTGTSDNGTTDNSTTGSGGSTDSSSASSASDSSTSAGSSSSGSTSSGSTSSGSTSSSGTTDNGYQGPRIGEEGVELDADGNGKIPADVLEKDIKNAYAKQGTTVDTVECFSDLRILAHRGSQSCTVTAAGKNHYGTVKITSASQSGIGYSLEFPNI